MQNNKRTAEIKQLLEKELGSREWEVQKPERGVSKETYLAKSGATTVFLKFDVNVPPLLRLSELGLTPKVITSGIFQNQNFVIQEFINGEHPSREWFASHLAEVAKFIKTYQNDKELMKLLGGAESFNLQKQIKSDLQNIEEQIKKLNHDLYNTKKFITSFKELKKQSEAFDEIAPKAIHADANFSNFLKTHDHIYMVDWDDILRSDSLRDIGLILWWYVPKNKWSEFFTAYGSVLTEDASNKIYWWVATRSLAISLWFLDIKKDLVEAKEYLEDFYLAVNKKDNPKIK